MIEGAFFENESMGTGGDLSTDNVSFNEQQPRIYSIGGCCGKYTDVMAASIKSVKRVLLAPKSKRKGPRGGVSEPFPSKLYDMLVGLETEELTHIASWMEHGRCFAIARQDLFISDVMPRYFKQSKITSFQRQLNLYGFQRVSSGVDKGCFYHPLFLRGRPDTCRIMLRTRTKGNYGTNTTDCGRVIPCESFYDLPCCPPAASEYATNASKVGDPEELPPAVSAPSSPQSEPISPAAIAPNEFPLIPYTTPVVPLLDNPYFQPKPQEKIHSQEQRTSYHYQSSALTMDQAPASVSYDSTFSSDTQKEYAPEYYNQSATDYNCNVVSPSYQTWASEFVADEATSTPNYEDLFWGCTIQCIDDDDVDAYDRSLDRRYQPCLL